MNILQIGTNDISGGAAMVSWQLKDKLESSGWETAMYVCQKESQEKNVHVIKRKLPKYSHYLLANDVDLFFTGSILKTKQFKKADVVHFHNLHGWYFSLSTMQKMSKIKPIVWTLHDEWAITPHCAHSFGDNLKNGFFQCPKMNIYPKLYWPNQKYLMWRKRNIYKNSDFSIVTPSKWLFNRVKKSVLADKDIRLIYNGIDTKIFVKKDKEQVRKELNLPIDKKIVIFLADGGVSNPFKGGNYFLRIVDEFAQKKNILFLCIGGQEQNNNWKKIKFVSKIFSREIMANYYSVGDVFLMTSLAENFPLTILEAMSCGLPVVSFDVGGVKEAVQHKKNGYLAKYKDEKDLINGLEFVLSLNNKDYEDKSEECRMRVKNNFDADIMVGQYLKLYDELISGKKYE